MTNLPLNELFPGRKPLIACVHLQSLPGSPNYSGHFEGVLETALNETRIYKKYGVDGLIVENFRDNPFFPDHLPPETIASMAVITRAVKSVFNGPVGVNALRNDAHSALAIALAAKADFIRVNIHTGAAVTDQGIIQGKAYDTLRLRTNLSADILIFADIRVKHASPLGDLSLEQEVRDATQRGLADGIIASGTATGSPVDILELKQISKFSSRPVLIGSGVTPDNLKALAGIADGFIIGSYFKMEGKAGNPVDEKRVETFTQLYNHLFLDR